MTTPTHIGQSHTRIDALGKVTGETLYPGDVTPDNLLHMKVLFARRPHARLRRIDTSAAEALPGVLAVLTASDVPANEYGLIMLDQPVLIGPGSSKARADVARCEGDQVALVVAETEQIATQARDLIVTEWEDLPVVTDPHQSMQPGAPLLATLSDSNILLHYPVRSGDPESVWEQCIAIVEADYVTPMQEHAYLAPEAGVAYIDEQGRITVEVAGQWTHEDQEQIAHALGLPLESVRVIYRAIGGAFGGREDMSVQIILALAVMRLRERGIERPIRIIWDREESIIGHHKRHAFYIHAKWGADADGNLLAAECRVIQDAGAYAYTSTKVLGNATLMVVGPYAVPNVKIDSYSVLTNNVPGGAFRGFGGPQGAFVAESQMNKLAAKLGIDPVELRMRNLLRDGVPMITGSPLPANVNIDRVLDACAQESGWQPDSGGWTTPARLESGAPHIRRGRGIACAFKNIGFSFGFPEQCWATIELYGTAEIERAILYHAGADCGQGAHTAMAQMTADALGIPVDKVVVAPSDTATSGNSGSASASRLTFMSGNSIRGAAEKALELWQNEERPAVGVYQYLAPATMPLNSANGQSINPNIAYGYVAGSVELEINLETGRIAVTNVVIANDVGKAINPQQIEGQIEGAVVQAHGYALLENFVTDGGRIRTKHLSNYLIPTVLDVPRQIKSLILEFAEPNGPFGARGMAEMPYLPYTPAVAAAIYDATGVWINQFPYTPENVLAALQAAGVTP